MNKLTMPRPEFAFGAATLASTAFLRPVGPPLNFIYFSFLKERQSAFQNASSCGGQHRAWRRFVKLFAVTLVTSLTVIYFLVLVLDPYDSGRMTNFAVSASSTKIRERPTQVVGATRTLIPW